MDRPRRRVLSVVAASLVAGCTSGGGGPPAEERSPTPTATDTTTPTVVATATTRATTTDAATPGNCDPADVTRPAVPTGTNIEGRPYPRKPTDLTEGAVMEYLADFETSFAWNRVLREATRTVTSLNVDTLEGFVPEEAGGGYLASGRMRVTDTTDDGETSEREYVPSYHVSAGPVHRVESDAEPVDPRTSAEAQLVQCGDDSDGK